MTRAEAYQWLAEAMGMTREDCHIAMMNAAQAMRVVDLVRQREIAA